MADTVKKLIRAGMGAGIEVILDGILFAVSMFLEKKTSGQKKD
ncbi:hypothetical protein ACQ4WQ_05940 [Janthinobacterium sp. GB1R12]